jgi:hypothetical protein
VQVADNDDAARQGLAVARERGESGGGLPARAMLVADRGLASIHNALFAAALEDPEVMTSGNLRAADLGHGLPSCPTDSSWNSVPSS